MIGYDLSSTLALIHALSDARAETDKERAKLQENLREILAGREAARAVDLLHESTVKFEELGQRTFDVAVAAMHAAGPMAPWQQNAVFVALLTAFEGGYIKGLGQGLQTVDPSQAVAKADARRNGPAKRLPEWATLFLPIAQAYCIGKREVSLGELVRLARDQKSIRGIPLDPKNIRSILKKMHEQHLLEIPGYAPHGGGA